MLILFLRAIILYVLVFAVIRLMGKRQLSELQPFDLVFTLLVADLASNPIGDTAIPLVYGVIPILALFLMQQLISYLSLKSEKARYVFSGSYQVVIAKGILQEDVMRKASYTISDLMEQLRAKDVFDINDVSYAILETNGSLSVLLKGVNQSPTVKDLNLKPHFSEPSHILIQDGMICKEALQALKVDAKWLENQLSTLGYPEAKEIFFAMLSPDGKLYAQAYQTKNATTRKGKT